MEIGRGIRRLGNGLVNVYLLEEAGSITIIDTGLPGYYQRELPAELQAMGRTLADVKAVVLTHAHSDHMGFAERIRSERQMPVWVSDADAPLARGEVKQTRDPNEHMIRELRPIPLLRFLIWGMRHQGLSFKPVIEAACFGDGATLDVPGAPQVVIVPGHTAGSAVLHVPTREAVFVGDAFATRNVLSGQTGPQLAPFAADLGQAFDSLARLDGIDARVALPGHGEPWAGSLREALAMIRRRGAPGRAASAA